MTKLKFTAPRRKQLTVVAPSGERFAVVEGTEIEVSDADAKALLKDGCWAAVGGTAKSVRESRKAEADGESE